MFRYIFVGLLVAQISSADDVYNMAKQYEGVYRSVSCSRGDPYTPITITVNELLSAAEISIANAILPPMTYTAKQLPVTKYSVTKKQDWGCWKERTKVSLTPTRLMVEFQNRFYNACIVPSSKGRISKKESFELLGDTVHYSRTFEDDAGTDQEDCIFVRD
ncbi:MAG: hypothetical protein AABZ06_05720 [Bdellovibrionota bacterium]